MKPPSKLLINQSAASRSSTELQNELGENVNRGEIDSRPYIEEIEVDGCSLSVNLVVNQDLVPNVVAERSDGDIERLLGDLAIRLRQAALSFGTLREFRLCAEEPSSDVSPQTTASLWVR